MEPTQATDKRMSWPASQLEDAWAVRATPEPEAEVNSSVLASHMRVTHGWTISSEPNMYALTDLKAMHRVAHDQAPGITATSLELFLAYARDAANWSGTPLVGGNVGGSKEERGNLTQLKRAGLITTFRDEGETWISFTDAGIALAATHGVRVS